MQKNQKGNLPTTPSNYNNPVEKERILMKYMGVFKNHTSEYLKTVLPKKRTQKNQAK
jgi:hypothetical protein